ncbi:MAG TPA: glutathione S-transferase family protein [Nannocystis sp.]|jgi:glutathione S-transferase
MALTLYYGSGSPYAWKVWLALEHKQLPYELRTLSFDSRENRAPEYLGLNPRGKVPTLVDGDFALWESTVILEYLEDRYPARPLLPADPRTRAVARRIAAEADAYLYPAQRALMQATLYTPEASRDPGAIAAAEAGILAELARFATYLSGDWFAGELSIADLTIYPYLRLIQRVTERMPEVTILQRFPAEITGFMRRFAALPYLEKTLPPHWRG